jgi:predicted lipoprotein with Yx(FWY)xxD motif
MPRPLTFRPSSHRIRTIAIALVITALAIGVAVSQAARPSKRVAAKADNPTLGKTVLTTPKGQTLYSLSAEKNGRFICTGSCLAVWHPLRVPSRTRPTGPVKLGTIERPEGGIQVTYRGKPLYRFGGDTKTGDANGEGIKDVGTWHAATVPSPPAEEPTPQPQPQPQPENPYPYGY